MKGRAVHRALKGITPPLVWGMFSLLGGRARESIRFIGNYGSWSEALSASGNYNDPRICNRVISAAKKVRDGKAAFERDGVAFPELDYNFPLAFSLCRAAMRDGRIDVVDFGGSLGSSYFQTRPLLEGAIRWAVVEQPNFVEAGRQEFTTAELTFHNTIQEARAQVGNQVLLLSGVLQYLSDPATFLGQVVSHAFRSMIIDRMPFMVDGHARLTVQHVPQQIYPASYPAWFFGRSLLQSLSPKYKLVASWAALDCAQPYRGRALWKGFLYELTNHSR